MTPGALMEFFLLTAIAAGLGVAGHYWKTHADPRPDKCAENAELFSLGATPDHDIEHAIWRPRYDEAGYWVGHSLRNLAFMVAASLAAVYLARYALLGGFTHEELCQAFGLIGLVPLFCG